MFTNHNFIALSNIMEFYEFLDIDYLDIDNNNNDLPPRKNPRFLNATKGPRSSRPRKSRFLAKTNVPKTAEEHLIIIMESKETPLMITSAKPLSVDPMPIGFGFW